MSVDETVTSCVEVLPKGVSQERIRGPAIADSIQGMVVSETIVTNKPLQAQYVGASDEGFLGKFFDRH